MITIKTDDSRKIMGKTSLPFEVSEYEVLMLKKINPGEVIDNFVDTTIRKDVSYDECDYSDNAVLSALYLKEKQYDFIRKYIKNGTEIARATGIFKTDKLGIIEHVIGIINKNTPEISTFLLNFLEPNFKIRNTNSKDLKESKFDIIGNTNQKLIVSERKQKSLTSILTDFKIPETISSDINQLYVEGFDYKTISSLLLGIYSFFTTYKYDETKTDYAKKAKEKYDKNKNKKDFFGSDDDLIETSDDEW